MNAAIQEILHTALQLPDRDRADLAVSLIESLDCSSDPDAQAAWAEEISRRLVELDSGTIKAVPWNEARQVIAGHAP
jgi:putative addiction module component (TIGR02574 family)